MLVCEKKLMKFDW